MELFERAVETVGHTVYLGDEIVDPAGSVTAIVTDPVNGEMPFIANGEGGHYTVQLGQSVTGNFRPKTLRWEYTITLDNGEPEGVVTPEEPIDIVRPYVSIHEYNRNTHPSDALLVSDFKRLESVARKVIESYTRQSFQLIGPRSMPVTGTGTNALQLPDRLVTLDNITIPEGPSGAAVQPSDYSLMNYVIFDPARPWELRKRSTSSAGMNVLYREEFFRSGTTYVVTGTWGWPLIPQDIAAATALLIRDYSDDDSLYREKYIKVIRAADWRMEFGATGVETTGNANADMMLEKYRNYRPEVI